LTDIRKVLILALNWLTWVIFSSVLQIMTWETWPQDHLHHHCPIISTKEKKKCWKLFDPGINTGFLIYVDKFNVKIFCFEFIQLYLQMELNINSSQRPLKRLDVRSNMKAKYVFPLFNKNKIKLTFSLSYHVYLVMNSNQTHI
jgi:hypothetical protein